jgi:uncharacterized protein (DUF1800 family)
VLDVILDRPQTAEFITAKLWREFVSADPDPREVQRIAKAFRNRNYDIKVRAAIPPPHGTPSGTPPTAERW